MGGPRGAGSRPLLRRCAARASWSSTTTRRTAPTISMRSGATSTTIGARTSWRGTTQRRTPPSDGNPRRTRPRRTRMRPMTTLFRQPQEARTPRRPAGARRRVRARGEHHADLARHARRHGHRRCLCRRRAVRARPALPGRRTRRAHAGHARHLRLRCPRHLCRRADRRRLGGAPAPGLAGALRQSRLELPRIRLHVRGRRDRLGLGDPRCHLHPDGRRPACGSSGPCARAPCPINARFGLPAARETATDPAPSLGWDPSHRRSEPPVAEAPPAETASEAIDRLERLAELRRRGDLTTDEYERFKQALLRDAEGAG